MTNAVLGAHKVGVTNHKTRVNRVNEHKKNGWVIFKTYDFVNGDSAFEVEQKVLFWLRIDKNLSSFCSKEQMPQGGYTETVDASEIDLPTIWAKVEELSKIKK
jgi:hypothetical protein